MTIPPLLPLLKVALRAFGIAIAAVVAIGVVLYLTDHGHRSYLRGERFGEFAVKFPPTMALLAFLVEWFRRSKRS